MSYYYFTMVKASPGFWENLLMKQIDRNMSLEFLNNKTEEIIITSNKRDALDKIITLSEEYPMEVFRIKVAGEDFNENYVYLYECSNGDLKLIKQGYEYCFCIKVSDRDKLDKGVFETFKKKVAAYYNRVGNIPLNEVHLDLSFENAQVEETDANLSVTIEYKTSNVRITAKKYGITCIEVEVEFIDAKGKSIKSESQHQNEVYEELPF